MSGFRCFSTKEFFRQAGTRILLPALNRFSPEMAGSRGGAMASTHFITITPPRMKCSDSREETRG